MTKTPKVGITHDVVIYPSGGLTPIGLILEPFSYRVSDAPDFIPRMAVGDPRGIDYSSMVSWVQAAWRGQSALEHANGQGYKTLSGFNISVPGGVLQTYNRPSLGASEITNPTKFDRYLSPMLRSVPAVYNVCPVPHSTNLWPWYPTEVVVPVGSIIFRPSVAITSPVQVTMQVSNSLETGRVIYDAVEYSTACIISTYYNSVGTDGKYVWGNIEIATAAGPLVTPVGSTQSGALAVYDDKLWRSAPLGDEIAYLQPPWEIITFGSDDDVTVDEDAKTWTRDDGSFISNGFEIGMTATWAGFTEGANNGDHVITELTALVMTCYGSSPVDEAKGDTVTCVVSNPPLGYWSAFTKVRAGAKILAMQEFIGRLMLGCSDGLYAYEVGRTYRVAEFVGEESLTNFAVMEVISGALYFNIQRALYRYTSGGLLEELDIQLNELEIPTSIIKGDRGVYIVATDYGKGLGGGSETLYKLDLVYGSTQKIIDPGLQSRRVRLASTLFKAPMNPLYENIWDSSQAPLIVGPMWRSSSQRYWITLGDPATTIVSPVQTTTLHPVESHVETGRIDLGYPLLYKTWTKANLQVYKPRNSVDTASGRLDSGVEGWVDLYYKEKSAQVWSRATPVYQTLTDGDVAYNFDLNSLISKEVELKPSIQILPTTNTTRLYDYTNLEWRESSPVELRSVEVDAFFVGPQGGGRARREYNFDVVALEPLQLMNGAVENSLAYINATMWSLFNSAAVHTVALPYPPPSGHTVEARIMMGDRGVSVPLLAYSMHGVVNIASYLPVKVLEV